MDSSGAGGSAALAMSNFIIVRCILDHSYIITIRKLCRINKTFNFYGNLTIRNKLREAIERSKFTLYGPVKCEEVQDDNEDDNEEDTFEDENASEDEYGGDDNEGPGFLPDNPPGDEDDDYADLTMEWNGLAVETYYPRLEDVDGEEFYSFSMADEAKTRRNRLVEWDAMEKLTLTVPQYEFGQHCHSTPVKFVLSDELHCLHENIECEDEYMDELGREVIVFRCRLLNGQPFNDSDNEYATIFRPAVYVRIFFCEEEERLYRVVRCDVDPATISNYSIRCSRMLLTA